MYKTIVIEEVIVKRHLFNIEADSEEEALMKADDIKARSPEFPYVEDGYLASLGVVEIDQDTEGETTFSVKDRHQYID